LFILCPIIEEHFQPNPADPASHEPSQARSESCACCGEAEDEAAGRRAAAETPAAEPGEQPAAATEGRAAQAPSGNRSSLDFHRIAKAVRFSVMLALKIQKDRLTPPAPVTGEPTPAEWQQTVRSARDEVERRVKETIEREAKIEPLDEESILRALHERFEEDEFEADLKRYPIDEVLWRICRNIGFKPNVIEGTGGPPIFSITSKPIPAWFKGGLPILRELRAYPDIAPPGKPNRPSG
jgi:hypothetical protein